MKTIIAAIGMRGELGKSGGLLWKLPEDLMNFKDITFGETVVMGRKTWESLFIRPLPGRRNIVVTRNFKWSSLGAERYTGDLPEDAYIIGGGEIYKQFLPITDTLRITRIYDIDLTADTYFPEYRDEFSLLMMSEIETSREGHKFRYETWIRKNR